MNRGPQCAYACKKKKRAHTHFKDPVVHARFRWIVETITRYSMKMPMFKVLKLDTVRSSSSVLLYVRIVRNDC